MLALLILLLAGFCYPVLEGERWRHASDLRLAMRKDSVLPDGANYRAAMTACVKRQQQQRALDLLQDVRSDDFVPGVIGYNAAVSICEKGKQRQRALALLMAVQEHSLPADVITCGAVSAFEKYQQWEEGY